MQNMKGPIKKVYRYEGNYPDMVVNEASLEIVKNQIRAIKVDLPRASFLGNASEFQIWLKAWCKVSPQKSHLAFREYSGQ